MVEIRDITREAQDKIDKNKLEIKLVEECFPGRKIKFDGDLIVVDNGIALKWFGKALMYVKSGDVLPQAEKFARIYEERFGLKEHNADFIIETDYSKKE